MKRALRGRIDQGDRWPHSQPSPLSWKATAALMTGLEGTLLVPFPSLAVVRMPRDEVYDAILRYDDKANRR